MLVAKSASNLLTKIKYMYKLKLLVLLCGALTFGLSSCSMVASKVDPSKFPEPTRSQIVKLQKDQVVVRKQYTQGSAKMVDAYSTIARACGEEKLSAKLKAQASAIRQASSSDAEAKKQVSRGKSLEKDVQSALANSNASTVKSKGLFAQGLREKDAAYMTLLKLSASAADKALTATKLIKKASPMQKVMLTASFDPIIHVAKDVPATLRNEKKFNENLKAKGKQYSFPVPKGNLATPKMFTF